MAAFVTVACERAGAGCTNTPLPRSTMGAMCGGACGSAVGAPGRGVRALGGNAVDDGAGSGAHGGGAGQASHAARPTTATAAEQSWRSLISKLLLYPFLQVHEAANSDSDRGRPWHQRDNC